MIFLLSLKNIMLGGNKDVTIEILKHLPVKTLLDYCSVSKTGNELCNNENLWRYRYLTDFGDSDVNKRRMNWKNFYLWTAYYRDMLEKDPAYVLADTSYTRLGGNTPGKGLLKGAVPFWRRYPDHIFIPRFGIVGPVPGIIEYLQYTGMSEQDIRDMIAEEGITQENFRTTKADVFESEIQRRKDAEAISKRYKGKKGYRKSLLQEMIDNNQIDMIEIFIPDLELKPKKLRKLIPAEILAVLPQHLIR